MSSTAYVTSTNFVMLPRADVPAGCPVARLMVVNDKNRAQWIKLPVDARQEMIDNVCAGKRVSGWEPVVLAEVSEQALNAARAQVPVTTPPAAPFTLASLLDAWVDGEVDLVARPVPRAPDPGLALVAPTALAALEQQDARVSTTMQRAIASVSRETGIPAVEIAEIVAPAVGIADAPAPWSAGAALTSTARGIYLRREQHDAQPLARDALRALHAEVVAEDRCDVVVGLADVQLTPQVELVRAATDDREGLCARVEAAGLARLQQEMRGALKVGELGITSLAASAEGALRAAASNTWNSCAAVLGGRERGGATRAQVTLRTRRVAAQGSDVRRAQVYAVVSEAYGEVDTDKIASACLRLVERLDGDMRATVAYDRERVRIDLSTSELTGDIQVGDNFRKVIRVRSNDAGRGGLHVSSIAERVACLNGNVISAEGAHTVIRHLGDSARLQERLREALAAATGALRMFSRQWVAASQRSIVDGIEPMDRDQRAALASVVDEVMAGQALADLGLRPQGQALLEGAYRGVLRQHELAPVKLLEEQVVQLRAAHWDARNAGGARDAHGGLSRAALANGLTLWAQSQPMAVAHQTEVVAGRVISGEEVLNWIARKE